MSIKLKVLFLILGLCLGSLAQDSLLGTDRSKDLEIRAKLDYEKKMRAKGEASPQQGTPAQASLPTSTQMQGSPSQEKFFNKVLDCKNGTEVRGLVLEYKGLGCELFYKKASANTSQARQNNGTAICESVFEKMKKTLEVTGFVCESKKD